MSTRRPSRSFVFLTTILGIAVVGSTLAIAQRSADFRFFDPLIDVKNIITKYAVEEPDEDALQRGAIEGMIETLDDPYAVYVPPQMSDEFEKDLTGEYVGIGAEVNMVDGVFTIVTPMEDSPAFHAGVLAGDKVVAIDGEPTEGLSIDECIDKLLGEEGTDVTVTVQRDAGETLDITITRAHIKSRSVRGFRRAADDSWDYLLDPDRRIGYIRVSQFTPNVADEIEQALQSLGADHGSLGGLIIDLRWNPGGLLDQAIRIADMFLDEGVIVSTKGRAYEERIARATKPGTLPDFPVAVIINGQSASASEILTGALVENGRAVAVGERTYGKGSVQSVHPLGGSATGASFKLTEQRYYLPSGRSLQRTDDSAEWGVDPDYFVHLDDDQLAELARIRRESEIIGKAEASETHADPDWIREHMADPQLAFALDAVQRRVDTGDWPERDPEAAHAAIESEELSRLTLARERLQRELRRVERRAEAIRTGAPDARADRDLWPDDTPTEGGTVEIRDADGQLVATLKITGPDLERWLIDADVEPE